MMINFLRPFFLFASLRTSRHLTVIAVIGLLALAGCAASREAKVTQFSTIDALMAGVYDGDFSCAQVARSGNLGLGTFDKLDGEMVVLDGRVYQVKSDGKVYRPTGALHTPFAAVTRFRKNQESRTGNILTLAELQKVLDRLCPSQNGIYAIRIDGEFPAVKTRSVTAQKKPYRELVEVTKEQSVFALGPVKGTLVGFRFPAYFKGLNVPGYHLHFLANDRRSGGHVLDLTMAAGATVETSHCTRFDMFLPGSVGAFSRANLTRDRSEEVKKVER
ncbi:MAG: acetolactate decarboxylase [Terrimicrobiaceae bacterium]